MDNDEYTPLQYNPQSIFVDDILYQIMLNADIYTIKRLCQTDKAVQQLCQSSLFWREN